MRPDDEPIFTSVANATTAWGLLCVAGLFAAGVIFGNYPVILLALVAAACSYIAMAVITAAISDIERADLVRLARLVNPTMTVMAILFWIAGFWKLWFQLLWG